MSEKEVKTRVLQGKVVSNKMDKTIVVRITRRVAHPLYEKIVNKSSKIQAHDAEQVCNEGDTVLIKECRPISKNKSWELLKVIEQAG